MPVNGVVVRCIDDLDGHSQVVVFHVPSNFVDRHDSNTIGWICGIFTDRKACAEAS